MRINKLLSNPKIDPLKNVALFAILILCFHFLFRYWAYDFHYWPINRLVHAVNEFLANLLFNNSVWTLNRLTNLDFTIDIGLRKIYILNGYVGVNYGCSGFKQFLQWIVLMTFFPGPWRNKIWFIPTGIIVVHLVNIFRISFLTVILVFGASQETWDFAHDYILRPFFYVIMFAMWVIWVEYIKKENSK